jgi:osmotically-inducible protein OsmY
MKKLQTIKRNLSLAVSVVCVGVMPLGVSLLASGCAGDRYHESTGEGIDDTATTGRVKKALHEDTQYKFEDVKVTTFKGVVQLSGWADSRDAKNRAGDIAKTVEGAKGVENNITVKQ